MELIGEHGSMCGADLWTNVELSGGRPMSWVSKLMDKAGGSFMVKPLLIPGGELPNDDGTSTPALQFPHGDDVDVLLPGCAIAGIAIGIPSTRADCKALRNLSDTDTVCTGSMDDDVTA